MIERSQGATLVLFTLCIKINCILFSIPQKYLAEADMHRIYIVLKLIFVCVSYKNKGFFTIYLL